MKPVIPKIQATCASCLDASIPNQDLSKPENEIALLLNVTVAQIELAIQESSASVEMLTESFSDIANGIEMIANAIEQTDTVEDSVLSSRELLLIKLKDAVVATQYHDQLSQRLSHISNSLTSLSRVIEDETQVHSNAAWSRLKDTLRDNYSSETETALFDRVIAGVNTAQAIQELSDQQQSKDNTGVEFF